MPRPRTYVNAAVIIIMIAERAADPLAGIAPARSPLASTESAAR